MRALMSVTVHSPCIHPPACRCQRVPSDLPVSLLYSSKVQTKIWTLSWNSFQRPRCLSKSLVIHVASQTSKAEEEPQTTLPEIYSVWRPIAGMSNLSKLPCRITFLAETASSKSSTSVSISIQVLNPGLLIQQNTNSSGSWSTNFRISQSHDAL